MERELDKTYQVDFGHVSHLFTRWLPEHIIQKLHFWACRIEMIGLEETRKIKSFHDEPLKGNRSGQRSIRLNRSYRAIYEVDEREKTILVIVVEVHKHGY